METLKLIAHTAAVGIAATAFMDLWLLLLRRLRVPTLDFALMGRWIGHAVRGRVRHDAIAKAEPVSGERALGWLLHYAVGIAFAALLVAVAGRDWLHAPAVLPALLVGVLTVAAPWLVMQPAMGAGVAASRTAAPVKNRIRSLANHTVFGLGLFLAASLIERIFP